MLRFGKKTPTKTKTKTKTKTPSTRKKTPKSASRRTTLKKRKENTFLVGFSRKMGLPHNVVVALLSISAGVMHKNINSKKIKNLGKVKSDDEFFYKLAEMFVKNSNPKMRKQAKFLENILTSLYGQKGGNGEIKVKSIGEYRSYNYTLLGMMIFFGLQLFVLLYSTTNMVDIASDPDMPLSYIKDIGVNLYTEGSDVYDIAKICANSSSTTSLGLISKVLPEGSTIKYATNVANYYTCFIEKKDDLEFKRWFETEYGNKDGQYDFGKEHYEMQNSMALVVSQTMTKSGNQLALPAPSAEDKITDVLLSTVDQSKQLQIITIDAITKKLDDALPKRPSRSTTVPEYKEFLEVKLLKLDEIINMLDENEKIEELVDKHLKEELEKAEKDSKTNEEITVLGALYSVFEKNRQGIMQMVTSALFSTNPVTIAAYNMKVGLIKHKLSIAHALNNLRGTEIEIGAQIDLLVTQSETLFQTFSSLFKQTIYLLSVGSAIVLMYKKRKTKVIEKDGKIVGLDLRDGESTGYLELTNGNLIKND